MLSNETLTKLSKKLQEEAAKIVSIHVTPFVNSNNARVFQAAGADHETDGWAVLTKTSADQWAFFDEYPVERDAVTCAETLAKFLKVPIGSYQWQTVRSPTLKESKKAFELFAIDQPFIKDLQFFPPDHHDLKRAGTYGHYESQKAKTVWDAACDWMRTVYGTQM